MKNIKDTIMSNITKITKKINDIFIDTEIKKEIISLYSYKKNYKKILIFIFVMPFSFLFFLINLFVIISSIIIYFFIFFYKKKLNYKNKRVIKYKKRFRFLKNFYLIILIKILIEFPKKKGFLLFYIITKKIICKEKSKIELEFIKKLSKSIFNRLVIKILLGIPFIIIKINKDLTDLIWDLLEFEYENKEAFFSTIILNIYKNVTPDYNKLIEKLKIIIIKTKKNEKIKFNSSKEIFKAIKYQENFKKDFINIKKKCIYVSVKHKISENKETKYHPTLIFKSKKDKIVYINETSSKELSYKKYHEKISKYIDEKQENCHFHKGSINSKKCTYYTKPIETDKKNIVIQSAFKNNFIKENVVEENTNNITASFLINLDAYILKTVEKAENEENCLIRTEEEKFIEWVKNNKEIIENDSFETLLSIQFFWEENKKIVENLTTENKIELAKTLGTEIDIFKNPSEVNFLIFKSFISKDLKIK